MLTPHLLWLHRSIYMLTSPNMDDCLLLLRELLGEVCA